MKNPVIALDPDMPEAMSYLGIIEDRHNKRAALLACQSEDGYVRLFVLDRSALTELLKPETHGVAPKEFKDFKINSPLINSMAHINLEVSAGAVTRAGRELAAAAMPSSSLKPSFILEDNLTLHHVNDERPLAIPTPQQGVYVAVDPIPGAREDQLIPFVLHNTREKGFAIFACRTLKM